MERLSECDAMIELVKPFKFLYDMGDRRYHDNYRKEQTWNEIAIQLNVTARECKRTWLYLRDSFRRAVKRQKDAILNGENLSSLKKWKYEDEMEFLRPYIREKRRPQYHIYSKMDSETVIENIVDEDDDDVGGDPIQVEKKPRTSLTDYGTRPLTLLQPDESEASVASFMKNIMQEEDKVFESRQDEIDIFFASIAATVKKFSPKEKAIAKSKVFNIISEMEINMLDQHETSGENDMY